MRREAGQLLAGPPAELVDSEQNALTAPEGSNVAGIEALAGLLRHMGSRVRPELIDQPPGGPPNT